MEHWGGTPRRALAGPTPRFVLPHRVAGVDAASQRRVAAGGDVRSHEEFVAVSSSLNCEFCDSIEGAVPHTELPLRLREAGVKRARRRIKQIRATVGEGDDRMSLDIRATMVADASRPAALLAKHLGHFEAAPPQSFSSNFWAYFSLKSSVQAEKWSKGIGKISASKMVGCGTSPS